MDVLIWILAAAVVVLCIFYRIVDKYMRWSEPENKETFPQGPHDILQILHGKEMNEAEMRRVEKGQMMGEPWCPDCQGRLVPGPEEGIEQCFCCARCGSEFNLTLTSPEGDTFTVLYGERISPPGPRNVGDRRQFYHFDRQAG